MALDRDVVIEGELHQLLESRAALVTTRIPLGEVGSAEHLLELESHVPGAARMLRAAAPDVIVFGCTSGVALMGRDRIEDGIREVLRGVEVLDPLLAMADNMRGRGIKRIALVTPYGADISQALARWLEGAGFEIADDIRIESDASRYADIPTGVISATAGRSRGSTAEAVVIACTGLRAVEAIEQIEDRTHLPVVTSNQALAWAVLQALTREEGGSRAPD